MIQFNYIPIVNKQDEAEHLIIELWDATNEITKKRLVEVQNQKNETLVKILKEKDGFIDFLKDVSSSLEQLTHLNDEKIGKRILHTLKGNSGAFGLGNIANYIHEIEDQIDEQIDLDGAQIFFANSAFEISDKFDNFLMDNFSILGINRQNQELSTFKISEKEIWEIERHVEKVKNLDIRKNLSNTIMGLKTKPANIFVSTFKDTVERLAEKLEKKIHFELEGGETKVYPNSVGFVLREVIHVIRNSCDHGIEFPDEREEQGKPSAGHIILHIQEHEKDKEIEILIKDDGNGINTQKLLDKAIKQGIVDSEYASSLSEEKKLELLFYDGVSTSEQVSQVSGRGVGMAALKQQVEQLDGRIEVSTQPGEGSTFRIILPSTDFSIQSQVNQTTIQWSPSLSIGIEEMDQQHQQLILYLLHCKN